MIHDARVVPTDRRLQLPAAIRRYIGDSVGRWEGSTLLALSGARDEERTKKQAGRVVRPCVTTSGRPAAHLAEAPPTARLPLAD